jgi:hypothetical protein
MPKTIDAEIVLPIATIKDKGLIYRGNCATVSTVQKCFEDFKE